MGYIYLFTNKASHWEFSMDGCGKLLYAQLIGAAYIRRIKKG